MCGIAGTSRLTPHTRDMLPLLALAMETRGKDSWGMSNGDEMVKMVGPVSESFQFPPEGWGGVILHTRAATHGSAKNVDNAHPFKFQKEDGSYIVGIHNGVISNHKELNEKYGRNFEVDSMHIYANLAEGKGVGDLEGRGALAWWEGGSLHLARFETTDLHMATLNGGELVFASTYESLNKSAAMVGGGIKKHYHTSEYHHFLVGMDEEGNDVPLDMGELPFKKKIYPPSYTSTPQTYGRNGTGVGSRASNFQTWNPGTRCYSCSKVEVDRKKLLICEMCLDTFRRAWVKEDMEGMAGVSTNV